MRNRLVIAAILIVWGVLLPATLPAGAVESPAPPEPGSALYRPAEHYPVLDEIRDVRAARQAVRDSLKAMVDEYYAAQAESAKVARKKLRLDWAGIDKPASPEAFTAAFHFPPQAQYATGTCWSFCTTSFLESEVARATGRHIKLSEMWLVYWEFVEKARRFVTEFGHSNFGAGSHDHAIREIYRQYGTVPAEAYSGLREGQERYDHALLTRELRHYLDWVEENDIWDEARVIGYVRSVLDHYMGPPPEVVAYAGRTMTPLEFMRQVLELDPDDYVSVVSTLKEPFGTWVLLDVHDNWRRKQDYLNLPLEDFYRVLREALRDGYTVALGGDVSEPGLDGLEDAALIPSWDIPAEHIDQASRELRIVNRTTTDDHGVHCVGWLEHGGRDWYLIKDSNRSSRLGRFEGYYFYTGDYIRLKMLAFMIHRDRLAGLLPQEAPPPPERFPGAEVWREMQAEED